MRNWLVPVRILFSAIVPCGPEDPPAGAATTTAPGAAPGTTAPAAEPPADWQARLRAAEEENARLKADHDRSVRAEAERLLLEDILPTDPGAYRDAEMDRTDAPRATGEAGDDRDRAPEPVPIEQEIADLRQQVGWLRSQRETDQFASELQGLRQEFPRMRVVDIIAFVAKHDVDANGLRKLAETSHRVEQARLDAYAEEEFQRRLEKSRAGAPPNLPGASGGTPTPSVPKANPETASKTLYDRLKSRMGWT